VEKSGVLEHNAAISLKRVRIQEKLLWTAYRNSLTLVPTAPSPTPTAFSSPRLGVCDPDQKTPITIISGTGKDTDFKFGQNNNRVHPNKSSLKSSEKKQRGRIQGLPNSFRVPLLSQEREKLRISNLAGIFRGSIRTKSH